MEYQILSNLEIKELVGTIPKILRFDHKDNFKSNDKKSNDKKITIFEQLPEKIQLKIAATSNSLQLLRTKKHYLEIGKQTYYDLVRTNMGPSFGELIILNNYQKTLKQNRSFWYIL